MQRFFFVILLLTILINNTNAQVLINEASNRNYKQIADEEGEYNDWIELYNSGNEDINLSGLALSDSKKDYKKWKFGEIVLHAGEFLLVYASGKGSNPTEETLYWKSAVLPENDFSYLVPDSKTPVDWYQPTFDDSTWETGKAGMGYADNDDRTVLPTKTVSVYMRKTFTVPDSTAILAGVLHVDYDDGFIAYLNGFEIARSNIDGTPVWNTTTPENHEAVVYSGGIPEQFNIDSLTLKNILRNDENVFCIEVHNFSSTSSDMSVIPYLSFAFSDDTNFFQTAPTWFYQSPSDYSKHTNFKLSNEGEKIYLSNTIFVVDSLKAERTELNHSTGRVTDGASQTGIFNNATPGASNNSSEAFTGGYAPAPLFSQKAGFYSSAFDLSFFSTDNISTIRYTIDGSEPTEKSNLYFAPIYISSTRSIKARCFSEGKLPGEVVTATYFINEEYTIPVLSVTTNNSNLYGTQGIFTNYDQPWNIPSYVEYFEKDKVLAFKQRAGMQVDGGAGGSRSIAQHSFRIEPGHGALGDGDLKYKLMPRRPNRSNYPSFYLRNGSNQYLVLPYKDALQVTALGSNTFNYYAAYHPVVVFINGKYFGVYELREKINDDYLQDNYNMDVDSLDFLGVSYYKGSRLEALHGSIDPFLADYKHFMQMDYQLVNYLDEVNSFLDLQNYTDYIIAESWVANNDWPQNNIKVFRCKSTGYKWRWAINDLELALKPNYWTTSDFDHIQYMLGTSFYYTDFWKNLIQNSGYKAYFINRFADLMNTSYDFSSVGPLEEEMYNEIFPEMGGEFKRWGNSNITAQLNTFTNNHKIFSSELQRRSNVVRYHLQSHFGLNKQVAVTLEVEPEGAGSIQISTITPTTYPWQGIYFTDIPVEVAALPNLGYQFSNWDANSFIDDIYQATVSGKFTGTKITLNAHFVPTESSYDGVVISEINYKPGEDFNSPDWIELCNLSYNEVNLKGWYFTDDDSSHVFIFDQDLMLASNQRVVVSNSQQQFKELYPDFNLYTRDFSFGLGSPSDEINLFNNENQPVVSICYSDIYPWALSDDSKGRTLELRTTDGDMNNPSSWFKGCIGGSPGTVYKPCNEPVVSTRLAMGNNNFDVKVFPVPANDYIDLDIQLEEDVEYCDIKIYNLMCSEVKSVSLGNLKNGYYNRRIDLVAIKENILILKLITNQNIKTVKIIKI